MIERGMTGILEGIKVLDLTRNVAGPYCTMILGDLGAEVVKIERPDGGDDTRQWFPPLWDGHSATFLALNRNKKSVGVDIDCQEGREIVWRLADNADVIVESFRQGSLAKRGVGYEQVCASNPRVVYCSITGFGPRGAHRSRPGYDPIIQAYSGIMSITGEAGRPPVRVGPSIVDMGTGMWCAVGILGALYERERSGRGCLIETSLLETGVAWVGYQLAGYLGSGRVPGRIGSRVAMIAPYEAFATADDYLLLAGPNDQIFARLCRVAELVDLIDDPRFASNEDRVANRDELHDILERKLQERPAGQWEEASLDQDIPCSRIRSLEEVSRDPQITELGLLTSVPHAAIPDLRFVDLPLTIGGQRAARHQAPPDLGQHSSEILRRIGYEEDYIGELRRKAIIV